MKEMSDSKEVVGGELTTTFKQQEKTKNLSFTLNLIYVLIRPGKGSHKVFVPKKWLPCCYISLK